MRTRQGRRDRDRRSAWRRSRAASRRVTAIVPQRRDEIAARQAGASSTRASGYDGTRADKQHALGARARRAPAARGRPLRASRPSRRRSRPRCSRRQGTPARRARSSSGNGSADLAGQRPDHLAVLRAPRLGGLPPGHRHRRPGGHADPRRRGGHGRAACSASAPRAATATTPASSTPASLSTCYAHQSRFATSLGQQRQPGPGHRLLGCTGLLLRRPPALRGAHQRRGHQPAELPVEPRSARRRACSPRSTSSASRSRRSGSCFALGVPRRRRDRRAAPERARQAGRLGLRDGLRRAGRRPGRLAALLPRPELRRGQERPARQPLRRHRARLVRRRDRRRDRACCLWAWWRGLLGLALLDLCAPPLALGYAIGRIGCQVSGDGDYGKPGTGRGRWPIRTAPCRPTQTVHPTPIYETLAMGLVALGAVARARPRSGRACCSPATSSLAGLERFLVEFLRRNDEVVAGLTAPQLESLAMLVAGLAVARGLAAAAAAALRSTERLRANSLKLSARRAEGAAEGDVPGACSAAQPRTARRVRGAPRR